MSDALAALRDAAMIDRAWGLRLGSVSRPMSAPLHAFSGFEPEVTVSVVEPSAIPALTTSGRIEVRESKKAFVVDKLRGVGLEGAHHRGSGNTVLWTPDQSQFFVSASPSWETTWVHVRFILRHAFLARGIAADRTTVHCVASSMPGEPDRGVAIVGPVLSGKTRLMNQLLMRNVAKECIEDDCALLDSGGALTSLIPTQHEVRYAQRLKLAGLIVLDQERTVPAEIAHTEAAQFAARCQVPWPAKWLPAQTPRPVAISLPDALRALALPSRSDSDNRVVDTAVSFVDSLSAARAAT